MIIYIDHESNNEKILENYPLFLDDIRKPSDVKWIDLPLENWVVVKNYKEFVECITKYKLPSKISFDHDLADEHYSNKLLVTTKEGNIKWESNNKEKTGYDCAKWIIDYCENNSLQLPKYTVHSMNFIGKQNIITLLERYKEWKQIVSK